MKSATQIKRSGCYCNDLCDLAWICALFILFCSFWSRVKLVFSNSMIVPNYFDFHSYNFLKLKKQTKKILIQQQSGSILEEMNLGCLKFNAFSTTQEDKQWMKNDNRKHPEIVN